MQEADIKRLIESHLPDAVVSIEGDGRHFSATIVSERFRGKSRLAQHRLVYDALGDSFDSEALHALAIKTAVPDSR
jgi:acid stress-induced BolA-like protein IbaG/YrbA